MQPFFSVTLFTGQQLILEAIQRWLQRPCADEAAVRQRRLGLKGLISLLLRTAATGVLATLLDAAIEFRRRQLLAAAAADDASGAAGADDGAPSRFPGLGMLSRAGVSAWKARLLVAIDELERRAEACGIESRRRFSPGKDADSEPDAATSGKPAITSGLRTHSPSAACLSPGDDGAEGAAEEESQSQRLGRTVEQLRELVQQGDPESERRLDEEVGSLVDLLLGNTSPPSPAAYTTAAARSRSVPARLDRLAGAGLRASRSRAVLAPAAPTAPAATEQGAAEDEAAGPASEPGSPTGGGLCMICMDRAVRVQVAECKHELCFGCARRLCAQQDHSVPECPFDRLPINGFVALATGRLCDGRKGSSSVLDAAACTAEMAA